MIPISTPGLLDKKKHQRQLLLVLGVCTILALTGDMTLYAVLPAYGSTVRGFDLASIGLMLSANRLVRLGSNPLVGLLLAGARRKRFVLAGYGLGALSTLLYVISTGTGGFLAGRLLWGISWSLINIGSYTMLLDAFEEDQRGWAVGVLQSMTFAGMAIDPFLGGLLSDLFDFRTALIICFALSALGFLIALGRLPETHFAPRTGTLPAASPLLGTAQALRQGVRFWLERLTALRTLLHPQNAAANYVYFAANFVGEGILLSTLSLYLRSHYGDDIPINGWALPIATAGGALLALRAAISALVAPTAGRLSDQAKRLPGGSRWSSLAIGLLLAGGGLALILALPGPWTLLIGVSLAASGVTTIVTAAPPLVREINPAHDSGTVLGLLANAADLGMALAPLVTYALLDVLSLETVYGLAVVMLVLGIPMVWGAKRLHAQQISAVNPPARSL